MVVVDEVRITVVEPLVIRHMGIGRMDAYALGHDLVQRPARANQVVIHAAGADLIARQDTFLQLVVQTASVVAAPASGLCLHDDPISLYSLVLYGTLFSWISDAVLTRYYAHSGRGDNVLTYPFRTSRTDPQTSTTT